MASPVRYIHIAPDTQLPQLEVRAPFRAVVIAEVACSPFWQSRVSEWLVTSGCLFMMAWGENCSSWDDSVDIANLERFGYENIPDSQSIMTTWHENESLAEMFSFSKNNSNHPTEAIQSVVLVHIAARERQSELLRAYAEA